MKKLASILYPVVFLFSFSLISMMSVDLPIENEKENLSEFGAHKNEMKTMEFYPTLSKYISTLESEFQMIPEDRKNQLREVGEYFSQKIKAKENINVTVICTHNSRRSHMGQLWLWAAANHYGVENFQSFSGGTEATAFYPSAVAAMKKAGFGIKKLDSEKNPKYAATLNGEGEHIKLFSKKYSHEFNPSSNFAAIMVCTSADKACPIVSGAEARFAVPYKDPKAFDGTDEEEFAYEERCRQIAREMFYAMSVVNK